MKEAIRDRFNWGGSDREDMAWLLNRVDELEEAIREAAEVIHQARTTLEELKKSLSETPGRG